MAYTRKTRDLWVLEGNYGYGFEEVTYSDTYAEAKQDLKDYRANEPYPFRIKHRRVPIAEQY